MQHLEIFDELAEIFNKNGYKLFLVGGSVRDYLLGKEFFDYDFVSDALPSEMRSFLPDANYRFEKYGCVKLKYKNIKCDITTLREEESYVDSRHPDHIKFTTSLEKDFVRRDFTINALYLDKDYNVIDYCHGQDDLKNKIIRFIGDPVKRINEDPLRILRAFRFKEKLGFEIDENSLDAILKNYHLINKLNPQKINEEMRKMKN